MKMDFLYKSSGGEMVYNEELERQDLPVHRAFLGLILESHSEANFKKDKLIFFSTLSRYTKW